MIRIVTDSTCDLPPEITSRHNITVVPAYVNIGSRSLRDGPDLTRPAFYADLASYDPYPTTAAPAPGEFAAVYEQLTAEGATHILSIHVSASLSGILNAAGSGAELANSCPVTLIDSQQLTMGLGFQALAAARAAEAGHAVAEIRKIVADQISRTLTFAAVESLDALRRGGRVSWVVAGVGNLLQVKPIIQVYEGEVTAAERVRTHKRSLHRLAERALAGGTISQIAFLNTNAASAYDTIVSMIRPALPAGCEQHEVIACPAIGVHIGAGAVGVALVVD